MKWICTYYLYWDIIDMKYCIFNVIYLTYIYIYIYIYVNLKATNFQLEDKYVLGI